MKGADLKSSAPTDYSFIAPLYDRLFNRPLSEGNQIIANLLQQSQVEGGRLKVLEVGVGSGFTLTHLPDHLDFVGIDLNERMLDLARDRARQFKRENVRLEVMDAKKLNYPENHFDLVLAPSVLSAMDFPGEGLNEMVRVARKGGKIAIVMNLRKRESLRSTMVKALGPLTRNFLGYRVDLYLDDLQVPENLKFLEVKDVNKFMGFRWSTFMLLEKT